MGRDLRRDRRLVEKERTRCVRRSRHHVEIEAAGPAAHTGQPGVTAAYLDLEALVVHPPGGDQRSVDDDGPDRDGAAVRANVREPSGGSGTEGRRRHGHVPGGPRGVDG
jgi:hypothetical protein